MEGGAEVVAGFRASRAPENWRADPHTWLLLALADDLSAGAIVVVRIPEADALIRVLNTHGCQSVL